MPQVYCTQEQLQRLAAISLDSLVGIEFETDCYDTSSVTGHYVPIDNPSSLRHFWIDADGTWKDET